MDEFRVRSSDREDALEFLMDSFEDQILNFAITPSLLLGGFSKQNLPGNCPYNICDEDVRKNLEEWEQGREGFSLRMPTPTQ